MSDALDPEIVGAPSPDLRDRYLWEGRFVTWPSQSVDLHLPRQHQETNFTGLGGLLLEIDHTALSIETPTASYYLEAKRVAEGYRALLGKTVLEHHQYLVLDGIGFAAERTDKRTEQVAVLEERLIYDRFIVGEPAIMFVPHGTFSPAIKHLRTREIKSIVQVPVRENPLLDKDTRRRLSSRDFLDQ